LAARFPQFRLKMGENRAAVSVAVFRRFAIYANVVRPILRPAIVSRGLSAYSSFSFEAKAYRLSGMAAFR